MEPRFGKDFSAIRVHTDATAARSAQALGARAYTVGSDLVFADGEFRPTTTAGSNLLAHELTHAVQQQGTASEIHTVGRPDDGAERAADNAAAQAMARPAQPAGRGYPPIPIQRDVPHVLRRAPATTWAGEFKPEKYVETYDVDSNRKTARPGVDATIAFVPNNLVDAEEIHFVQTVTTLLNDQPYALNKTVESRMIPAGDPGEGLHVDAPASQPSPFIDFQYGVHYSAGGYSYTRDAKMTDPPGFEVADSDSASMTLESAAVCTKGAQKGVYYGAVQWGWTRDPKQRPKKLAFRVTAQPVPGGTLFKRVADLFGASKTSSNQATDRLPTVARQYTTRDHTQLVADPSRLRAKGAIDLPINTQVELTETPDPTKKNWKNVIVISGRHAGKMGWIAEPLSDIEAIIPKRKKK